jgi:DNA helicase-2/ATP-dependent DNA helicase PcrA
MLHDGSEDGQERWANLLELREVVGRYADLEPGDALDRLLEETALVADQDAYDASDDRVTLITLHAAKGLEFDVVFIVASRRGCCPRPLVGGPARLEEERRLASVGLTWAKERLLPQPRLPRATWGLGGGMSTPSRFLAELPRERWQGRPLALPAGRDQTAGTWTDDASPETSEHAAGPPDPQPGRRGRDRGTGFRAPWDRRPAEAHYGRASERRQATTSSGVPAATAVTSLP